MTHLNGRRCFLITLVWQHAYQALLLPVLQHLLHRLMSSTRPFHGNALLLSLIEGEGYVKTLEDGIVSTPASAVVWRRPQ